MILEVDVQKVLSELELWEKLALVRLHENHLRIKDILFVKELYKLARLIMFLLKNYFNSSI